MSPLATDLFNILASAHTEGRKIEAEVQTQLAEANAEVDHRLSEDNVNDYARALERAQRKLGVREIVLQPGDF